SASTAHEPTPPTPTTHTFARASRSSPARPKSRPTPPKRRRYSALSGRYAVLSIERARLPCSLLHKGLQRLARDRMPRPAPRATDPDERVVAEEPLGIALHDRREHGEHPLL